MWKWDLWFLMHVLGAACCQQIQIHPKPNIEKKSMLCTLSGICPWPSNVTSYRYRSLWSTSTTQRNDHQEDSMKIIRAFQKLNLWWSAKKGFKLEADSLAGNENAQVFVKPWGSKQTWQKNSMREKEKELREAWLQEKEKEVEMIRL